MKLDDASEIINLQNQKTQLTETLEEFENFLKGPHTLHFYGKRAGKSDFNIWVEFSSPEESKTLVDFIKGTIEMKIINVENRLKEIEES